MSLWIWLIIAVAIVIVLTAVFALIRSKQRKSTILAAAGPGTGEQS